MLSGRNFIVTVIAFADAALLGDFFVSFFAIVYPFGNTRLFTAGGFSFVLYLNLTLTFFISSEESLRLSAFKFASVLS